MLKEIEAKLSFISDEETIAIACSGGSDSRALAEILLSLGKKIIILIIDHRIRLESSSEANLVKSWFTRRAPVEILVWQEGSSVKSNLQARAREARYELLLNFCQENQIKFLATGHHKNDQVETILLNIMRGSGIKGLVGMKEKSFRGQVTVLRPLLNYNKEVIKNYLIDQNLSWIEDPSNQQEKYERVKIRKLLQEVSESSLINKNKLEDRLLLLSKNALRNQNFLDKYINSLTEKILSHHKLVKIIDWALLSQEEEEVILLFFQKFLSKKIKLKSLEILHEAIEKGESRSLGGFLFHRLDNRLYCITERKKIRGINQLKKNQVIKVKNLLLNGYYRIVETEKCYEALELVKLIPRLDFFTRLPYQILDDEMIIPDLGIAIDRF